jgi:hypothetical protein
MQMSMHVTAAHATNTSMVRLAVDTSHLHTPPAPVGSLGF